MRTIHENGGRQSRQRLDAHGRRDRRLRPRPSATTMIKPSGRSSMTLSRRSLLKSAAAVGALTASAEVKAPALAQNKPVRIGILAPRSGIAAAPGENGIRATQWAVDRFNAQGGIAGRKIELVIEEESSPKDTIERFSRLVQQEKVDCVQGIISTGVGLALGPAVEQAHAPEVAEATDVVFHAAGFQPTLMKKEFTPEGMLFGHNTLYFANPNASPVAKEFVAWYAKTYNDYPEWEADRAYFALASYKAAVEAASKAKNGSWPAQDDVIGALVGLSIESLGGRSSWRKDHIAEQTFVQGL